MNSQLLSIRLMVECDGTLLTWLYFSVWTAISQGVEFFDLLPSFPTLKRTESDATSFDARHLFRNLLTV